MKPEIKKKKLTNTYPILISGYSVNAGCRAQVSPLGVKWNRIIVTASSVRRPVIPGSAGLRTYFSGCSSPAGSPVDVDAVGAAGVAGAIAIKASIFHHRTLAKRWKF